MKNDRKNNPPNTLKRNIVLPIGTLIIVGLMIILSGAYEPNWAFSWKELRPEISDTVKMIERYGSVTSGVVGGNGKTPQQWHRRKWLIKNANKNELIKLLEYPDGAVKVTAYEGLIRSQNTNKYELVNQALNDTTTFFNYQSGSVGYPKMIGEYLVENVIGISNRMPPPPPDRLEKYNLSEEEIVNLKELYNKRIDKKDEYLRKVHE